MADGSAPKAAAPSLKRRYNTEGKTLIRPTFLGFETAKKGLTAAQKGLDVTGQNLTNWDSAGYTRQRITQVAVAPDSYRNR